MLSNVDFMRARNRSSDSKSVACYSLSWLSCKIKVTWNRACTPLLSEPVFDLKDGVGVLYFYSTPSFAASVWEICLTEILHVRRAL
jgi:hypothetical protein